LFKGGGGRGRSVEHEIKFSEGLGGSDASPTIEWGVVITRKLSRNRTKPMRLKRRNIFSVLFESGTKHHAFLRWLE